MSKYIKPRKRIFTSKAGATRSGINQTPGSIVYRTDSDDDTKEFGCFLKGIPAAEKSVWGRIDRLEQFAKNELLAAGFDHNDAFSGKEYSLSGGRTGSFHAALNERELEPEWYAGKILIEARSLRKHIADGDLFLALHGAFLLEGAMTGLNISNHELDIKIGQDTRSNGGKSLKFSDEDKEDWLQKAEVIISKGGDDYRKSNGKINYASVATKIRGDIGLPSKSHQTLHRHLLANKQLLAKKM